MTQTYYRTGTCKTDHTKFGGTICLSDFDTNHANGSIASRIESDRKFDEQCRKDTEYKTSIWRKQG